MSMLSPTVFPDLRDGYVELVREILTHGRPARPRNYKTWELEDVCFLVEDPQAVLPVGVGRDLNVAIGAAEALCLCAGIASPSLMVSVSDSFRRFMDGGALHGAYGWRVRPQMESVIRRLRSDRDSRQAIVQIWDPLHDMQDTRDLPCTLGLGFRLRDDKLHVSTTMRSQDAFLGLAYDGFMFCQLGLTVANVLGVEMGSWRHHVYSFHVYERNLDQIDKLHPHDPRESLHDGDHGFRAVPREPSGFGMLGDSWESARREAESVYDRANESKYSRTQRWYNNVLRDHHRVTSRENFSS